MPNGLDSLPPSFHRQVILKMGFDPLQNPSEKFGSMLASV
jgi:hypothetical protein